MVHPSESYHLHSHEHMEGDQSAQDPLTQTEKRNAERAEPSEMHERDVPNYQQLPYLCYSMIRQQ